ncbi:MAG: hypothetical protein GX580_15370, partial [Candidatus Hydrogenedens sp.]|nr:hypothetical protein [Candidatus Hydrogenedens sp.]
MNPLGLWMERGHSGTYRAGAYFAVAVTIDAAQEGQLNAMGLRETIPEGWELEGVSGVQGDAPDIYPPQGATGLLEFAWIMPPSLPYAFVYTLRV